jgi:hypothetical protein
MGRGSYQLPNFGAFRTLTEHWNGTASSVVASPDSKTGDNDLYSVAAISPNDAWAAGISNVGPTSTPQTLIGHWDGTNWSIVSRPSLGQSSSLAVVRAVDGGLKSRGKRALRPGNRWNSIAIKAI